MDVSPYGAGLQMVAVSRTAHVRTIRGDVVAESETVITDEDVFVLFSDPPPPVTLAVDTSAAVARRCPPYVVHRVVRCGCVGRILC